MSIWSVMLCCVSCPFFLLVSDISVVSQGHSHWDGDHAGPQSTWPTVPGPAGHHGQVLQHDQRSWLWPLLLLLSPWWVAGGNCPSGTGNSYFKELLLFRSYDVSFACVISIFVVTYLPSSTNSVAIVFTDWPIHSNHICLLRTCPFSCVEDGNSICSLCPFSLWLDKRVTAQFTHLVDCSPTPHRDNRKVSTAEKVQVVVYQSGSPLSSHF